MTNAPVDRQREMQERVAREEARDRRTIAKVQVAASVVLLASTLLAWENHPRVEYHGGATPYYFVSEVGHTIGLKTVAAGLLALALGVVALLVASGLRRVRLLLGWFDLCIALTALGACVVEIIQLMLGRRNWLDHVTSAIGHSGLGAGVGIGVWIATVASVALVANASTYLWLGLRLWRKNPLVTD